MARRLFLGVVLAVLGIAGLIAGEASSALHVRKDPPVKAQTFPDPAGDNTAGAADVQGVVAENWSDGTIGFHILLPRDAVLDQSRGMGIGVYIDTDNNRTTGQMGDDYFIAIEGHSGGPPLYELQKYTRTWGRVASPSLAGEFDPTSGLGIIVTIDKSELGIGAKFNFDVWSSVVAGGGVIYNDYAPEQGQFFTFTLGTGTPTTTTTAARCTVPKVSGKTVATAKRALRTAGCKTGTVSQAHSATVKKGRVIKTKPAAGSSVAATTGVAIVVSSGK
jgi:hypothetical protein